MEERAMKRYAPEVRQVLSVLPQKQQNSFRARKSKYVKRGFTEEEAIQRALQPLAQVTGRVHSHKLAKGRSLKKAGSTLGIAIIAAQLIISSALLVYATVRALGGPSVEHFAVAILLETGVISLFLTQSKCIWKKLAMRIGAVCLVLLGFFLLHTTANADQYRKITQAVSSADDVSSIKKTKDKLETDLAELPATHRTARNELLSQIETWDAKLAAAKANNAQGSGVEALQQIFMSLTLMRLALQFLNVFFGHLLLERLKEEGFLT
jgi:hypothetical protein